MKIAKSHVKQILNESNISDDILFYYVMQDKSAAEEIIQTILDKPELQIVESNTQIELRNLTNKGVRLDALCKDKDGNLFNVEMQNSNDDDQQRRLRYYIGSIDVHNLNTGDRFSNLADIYAIMLCNFDIFKKHEVVYYISRRINNGDEIADNGVREIYVNLKERDNSKISKLSEYILNSNGYIDTFPNLSKRVEQIKNIDGDKNMSSKLLDKYVAEGHARGVAEGVKEALNVLGISEEEYNRKLVEYKNANK